MRLIYALIVLALLLVPAWAQEQPQEARLVLVIGDRLAGGMGNGLQRMAEDKDNIAVVNRFDESSGLSRPEIYDWAAAIPKIAEGKSFSAAIVLIGINDRRDMRDGDNVLKFGTPEWDALYKQRIDALIDALTAQKIAVHWMGEPPMADPGLDADMQNITALIKERVSAKQGQFIDLRAPFLSPSGGYAERGPDETGNDRRLREGDGITFMKVGNNRLGQIALQSLKNAPQAVVVPAAAVPPVPVSTSNGPIFGHEGADADMVVKGSEELAASVANDEVAKKAAEASVIGVGAAAGSSAESLFTTGLAAPAPSGRFDDFSLGN